MTDVFETVRPHMDLTVDNILAHINTVFVLRTKVDKYTSNSGGSSSGTSNKSSPASGWSVGGMQSMSSGYGGKSDAEGSQDHRRPPSPTSEHSK